MLMRIFVIVFALLQITTVEAQPPADIIEYINRYKRLAMQEMQRTGVPAAIKLAQGIHETSAGKSVLVLKSNNHFGIKCKANWTGKSVSHDDDARGECFRSYNSPMDSYRDHSNFLRGSERYASLFKLDPTDYSAWAYGLRKAGYATNPKYAPILIKIIEEYNLAQYTLIAMGKMSPEEEVIAQIPGAEPSVPELNAPVPEIAGAEEPAPAGDTLSARQQAILDAMAAVIEERQATALAADSAVDQPREIPAPKPIVYPAGEFVINNTPVVFARQGTPLLSLARQHNISMKRLLEFNDLKNEDVLLDDQLIYLQRKRKTGENEFHTVAPGESLYSISQAEGIRMESLLDYNYLQEHMEPAVGEKLYMKAKSASRPLLRGEVAALNRMGAQEIPVENRQVATTHVVKSSETLYGISKKYGVALDKIREWNKLPGFDVKAGQQLVIYKN